MPRKGEVRRREVLPDPKYQDRTVTKFMNNMMPKIEYLRANYPNLDIEVDGGVGPGPTIEACAKAGANMIVSGTGVVKATDPSKAMNDMKTTVSHSLKERQNCQ